MTGSGSGSAQSAAQPAAQRRRLDIALVFLAFLAGSADAVAFVGFGGVFVGNMSGNVILLGVSVSSLAGVEPLRPITSLVGFAVGVLIAVVGRRVMERRDPGRGAALGGRSLWLVAALLLVSAVGWLIVDGQPDMPVRLALIFVAAVALGVQSTLVARLALPGVSTTFITGTMISVVAHLLRSPGHEEIQKIRIGVLVALVGGAAAGAGLLAVAWSGAMFLPAAGVVALALWARGGARS